MSISSNTLFHFVSERKYLEAILNKDFYPRYCLENFGFNFLHFKKAYILMKCFCDIPLSQIMNHTRIYGNYGIGFSKEWGIKRHINPILYLSKDSNIYNTLNSTARKRLDDATRLYNAHKISKDQYHNDVFEALSIIAYIKPISGRMPRGNTYLNNVNFYNEREWRYVPLEFTNPEGKNQENHIFLLTSELADEKESIHKIVQKNMQIDFQAKDVKYIFVKDENDRACIYDLIAQSKHYTEDEKKSLISKMLTIKQIEKDL